MACLICVCSVVLLTVGASAFPVYDVDQGEPLPVNDRRGTAFSSMSKLEDSRVIECYTDYGDDGAGVCKVLRVNGMAVTEEASVIFDANNTQYVSVATLSPSAAVVCYLDHLDTEHVECRYLNVGGSSIDASEPYVVDDVAEQVSFLSVASLTPDIGIICWSEPLNPQKDRAGVCNKLTFGLGGNDTIAVGTKTYFDLDFSTSDVTVRAFSGTSAVVCWSAEGDGECRALSLSGSGSEDFDAGSKARFFSGDAEAFVGLVLVKFTAAQGLVCWADGVAKNQVDCKSLLIDGTALSYGDASEVTAFPSTFLAADALTEDAALVCYSADPGGSVTDSKNFDGRGTCNIVGVMVNGSAISAGPPNEVNSGTTQHLAVASSDERSAVLCYSDGGAGSGNCKALSMAETTTSSTDTSTNTETTTSPHTTTESSTISETSTTSLHTTSETSTTSSVHTTTVTRTGVVTTQDPEDSGSSAPDLLGAFVALLAAIGVELC